MEVLNEETLLKIEAIVRNHFDVNKWLNVESMYSDELMWNDIYCEVLKQDISINEASIIDARELDPFVFEVANEEVMKNLGQNETT